MISKILPNKYSLLSLTLISLGVLFFSAQAFAVTTDQAFFFKSGTKQFGVEYQGSPTGEPRFNSGANFFDMDGTVRVVDPAYQARVTTGANSPFQIEGYAWNDSWGWISFRCASGHQNLGLPCFGGYQTYIDMTSYPIGYLTGQAWNPNIGTIDFDWICPPANSACSSNDPGKRTKINFNTSVVSGYAWNDRVGWLYFSGYIDPLPDLTGFACGNGTTEPPEQCDDGNLNNDDACRNDCTENICGDFILAPNGYDGVPGNLDDEECDDNNNVNGDGCSSTCKDEVSGAVCGNGSLEPGEFCDEGTAYDRKNDGNEDGWCVIDNTDPAFQCQIHTCGDGYLWAVGLGGDEECDDGNNINTDACRNDCTITPSTQICGDGLVNGTETCDLGHDAYGNSLNKPNTACPYCQDYTCGDHYLYPAFEQCDDGNTTNDGNGCTATCQKDPTIPMISFICGDNIVTPPETCDDGNLLNGDGCSSTCGPEISECGDDNLNPYTEDCDDGNLYNGDGCSALCKDEVPGAVCGNNSIEKNSPYGGNEECDDGNVLNGDGCNGKCKIENAWCGDGVVNGIEQCDDANSVDNDVCKNDCTFGDYSICGDGFVTFGEACDDGNNQNRDGCSSVCTQEHLLDPLDPESPVVADEPTDPYISINDCEDIVAYFEKLFNINIDESLVCNESCGNGYREGVEECDDGNTMNNDGCSSTCIDTTVGTVCGNGIEEIVEECDDGNNNSGDGCSATCTDEDQVIYLNDLTCEEAFALLGEVVGVEDYIAGYCNTEPYCGDGIWQQGAGEECDASDHSDPYWIYCNDWCEFEPIGWCGDGIHDPGEECDDANYQNGDGCNEWCEYEYVAPECNDGFWNLGEECDDSDPLYNAPPDTTCDPVACKLVLDGYCGDHDTSTGEECDPTDPPNGGFPAGTECTNTCELEVLPEQISCFPYADVVKIFDPTRGDVYQVNVTLNCEEDPSVENPWNVEIDEMDEDNTIDCNQMNADSDADRGCLLHTNFSYNLTAPQNDSLTLDEVYSYAPTGYTSQLDDENNYTLNTVSVSVSNSNNSTLFYDIIPVNYSMDFSPLLSSQTLYATYPSSSQPFSYLDLGYNDIVKFRSVIENNLTATLTGVSSNYTLSVGSNPAYDFKFDKTNDDLWDSPLDGPELTRYPNSGHTMTPLRTWTAINTNSAQYDYPAAMLATSDLGPAEGESLGVVINYTYDGHTVSYPADKLPKAEDFRVDGYGVQITGPVNTDKILGSTNSQLTQVGNVGEAVKRKDITRNLSRIVKSNEISPSISTFFNFDISTLLNNQLNGGDHLSYTIGDGASEQRIYYFKDDVVISKPGGLNNNKNRAVITEGGDVYIDSNVTNLPVDSNSANEDARLEIVALRDQDGHGGNVFIGPNVSYLSANIVADGSIFPYDGNSKSGEVPDFVTLESNGDLDAQLTFVGSLTSNNTIGGASVSPYYKGDGSRTSNQNFAKIYDLNFFRRHGLVPARIDSVGNPQECNNVSGLQIGDTYLTANTCGSQPSPSDMKPVSTLRWSGRAANENYGMYFNYRPPAKNSVIFGEGVNINVSGN